MQDEIICYCSNVTERQITDAIKKGARTLHDIRKMTNACTLGKCRELSPKKRCCSGEIIRILNEHGLGSPPDHQRIGFSDDLRT
jgi:bacterioferritin-associated ferredoxin